jgi:hypothetical protein
MLQTIDSSLEVLGRVASTALRLSFKKVQRLEWQSVAEDPEPLERHIRAVFSSGAVVLIDIINKNICREYGLSFSEGASLAEYVREALASDN